MSTLEGSRMPTCQAFPSFPWSTHWKLYLGAGCPAVGSQQEEGEAEDRSQFLPQRCFQTQGKLE